MKVVVMMKLFCSLVVILFAVGCGVQGECVPVEGSNACVLYGTPEEVSFTGWAMDVTFDGRENMDTKWKVIFYDDVWELNEISDPSAIAEDMRCKTGYLHKQNLVVHALPVALIHELHHIKVMEESDGWMWGDGHLRQNGWGTDTTERVRELDILAQDKLPYESETACHLENRGD